MREFFGLLPVALVPYTVVVGVIYLALLIFWKGFVYDDLDVKLLWLPPVFYLGLDTLQDRQGLAGIWGVGIVSVVVTCALPLKVVVRRARPAVVIASLGCLAAVLAWLILPKANVDVLIW